MSYSSVTARWAATGATAACPTENMVNNHVCEQHWCSPVTVIDAGFCSTSPSNRDKENMPVTLRALDILAKNSWEISSFPYQVFLAH